MTEEESITAFREEERQRHYRERLSLHAAIIFAGCCANSEASTNYSWVMATAKEIIAAADSEEGVK